MFQIVYEPAHRSQSSHHCEFHQIGIFLMLLHFVLFLFFFFFCDQEINVISENTVVEGETSKSQRAIR